jgi:HNH endonuclease
MSQLTQQRVKELLYYDPDSGSLIWNMRTSPTAASGKEAGSLHGAGYRQIRIDGKVYLAHRVIWLWVYGEFPPNFIDHVNHDRLDNRLINLRLATNAENQQNRKASLGVAWCGRRKKWRARVDHEKVQRHLGYFDSKELAVEARKKYEAENFTHRKTHYAYT